MKEAIKELIDEYKRTYDSLIIKIDSGGIEQKEKMYMLKKASVYSVAINDLQKILREYN